jgi:hypothetical protein
MDLATVPAMPAVPAAPVPDAPAVPAAMPTEVTKRFEIETLENASDVGLLAESPPSTSASGMSVEMTTVGSLGGEALGEELTATTVAIESLERASARFETFNAGPASWDQEIFSIHAALLRLESELEGDELQSSADD